RDAINFNEIRSFPDDEFLEPRSKVTQCSSSIEYFPYIVAYETILEINITPIDSPILQDSVSPEEPPKFTSVDDHPTLNEPIIDVQPSSSTISPSAKGILRPPVSQDRRSTEKHIELVNIIGKPLAGSTTKSRIRDSDVASAHECLYVNFLSKLEPKKLIEALEEEGWVIVMQEEL
ncbi:hypothetical protein Tco_0350908, partial [Tanacetum coccineum]